MPSRLTPAAAFRQSEPSGSNEEPPIITAAKTGDAYLASSALTNGDNPNTLSSEGKTALYISSEQGNEEIVNILLENNADPNFSCLNGTRPIAPAILIESLNIVKALINHGAQLNFLAWRNLCPLTMAVHKKNIQLVRLLLDSGADVDGCDGSKAPLVESILHSSSFIFQLLLERGANPNGGRDGRSPLIYAHECNGSNYVNLLLKYGAKSTFEDVVSAVYIYSSYFEQLEILMPLLYIHVMDVIKAEILNIAEKLDVPIERRSALFETLKRAIYEFEKEAPEQTPSDPITRAFPSGSYPLYRNSKNKFDSPVEFYNFQWKIFADNGALYQDDLAKLDPELMTALRNYCRNHQISRREVLPPPASAKVEKTMTNAIEGSAEHELARRRLQQRAYMAARRAKTPK